jgi:predicted enzyme related to lactoylglutathione lyase
MNIRLYRFKAPALAGLLMSAGILLLLGGCSALPRTGDTPAQNLTGITDTATNIHHPGKFVWHDLLTPDAAASRKFYGALLGWTFSPRGNYVEIHNGTRKIGGIAQVEADNDKQKTAASWLASMSVANVDAALAEVKAHKGKVINGPVDMPLRGRGALISDSQGAHLVLLHAKDGDPEDRKPQMGDWLWNEIWTSMPDETIAFYQAAGGYSEVKKGEDYAILINQGKWRAGVRFSDNDVTVRWVPAIRVSDPGSLLAKVEALGGTVWIRPGDLPGNPDTALISDNMGALLILQRWTFSNVQEGH